MLVAFFESIKYVGHMFPLALLRVYMGYYFLLQAMQRYEGDYLVQPRLAATISEWLPFSSAPDWYRQILESTVVPNWQFFAYTLTYFEFLIGLSFIVGFLVRPIALVGVFLSLNYIYISGSHSLDLSKFHLITFLVLAWLGAGRCLGMDYFFFKRKRGIWW